MAGNLKEQKYTLSISNYLNNRLSINETLSPDPLQRNWFNILATSMDVYQVTAAANHIIQNSSSRHGRMFSASFISLFGCHFEIAGILWNSTKNRFNQPRPVYLLYGLYFLRTYNTEVSASLHFRCICKTYRTWYRRAIQYLSELNLVRVVELLLLILYSLHSLLTNFSCSFLLVQNYLPNRLKGLL